MFVFIEAYRISESFSRYVWFQYFDWQLKAEFSYKMNEIEYFSEKKFSETPYIQQGLI